MPLVPVWTELNCTFEMELVVLHDCRHNHYDHLDSSTIKELANRFPDAVWCVPLGNAELIKSFGATHVTELDWWGETVINIPIKAESIEEVPPKAGTRSLSTIRAVCTPCQHFSGVSSSRSMSYNGVMTLSD